MKGSRYVHIVAVTRAEAVDLYESMQGLGNTRKEADTLLRKIHQTADPFYAKQYRIFTLMRKKQESA